MPVYENVSNQPIYLDNDNIVIKPGETKTTDHFYNNPQLRLVSIKPYKSPYDFCDIVTVTSDSPFEYTVLNRSFTIIPLTGHIKIHLNEYPSDKTVLQLQNSTSFYSNTKNLIYKIFIEPYESGSNVKVFIGIQNPDFNLF